MNKAGKVTLVKSLLNSLPIYTIQNIWLPQLVCDDIDKIVRNFIWNKDGVRKGINLVNWNMVTRPKKEKLGCATSSCHEHVVAW